MLGAVPSEPDDRGAAPSSPHTCRRPVESAVLVRTVLVLVLAAALGAPRTAAAARPEVEPRAVAVRPDIVLIKTDDQVFDRLGRMRAFLPRVAAHFAQRGREYTSATVSSPSCCQSRASTFVGRYPHNAGVWSQGTGATLDTRGGIAPYLQRSGYFTALVGKYLNLVDTPPGYAAWTTIRNRCDKLMTPTQWCDPAEGGPIMYYGFLATDATGTRRVSGDPATGRNHNTPWSGERLLGYLERALARPTPFFLEWNPTAPHTYDSPLGDMMPEPKYRSLPVPGCTIPHEADRSDKPAFVRAWPARNGFGTGTVCPASQRALRSVDDVFGRLVDRLAAAGRLENTLLVFTSDNGLMNGEHGMLRKFVAYEPSVRVPLLVSWPGRLPVGSSRALVSNIDLLPTILEAAGVVPDPALPVPDGRSLLSTGGHSALLSEYRLDDPEFAPVDPAPIPTWASMWDGRFKYIETYGDRTGTRVVAQEYYDTLRDPAELTNRIAVDPAHNAGSALVASLHDRLAALRQCRGTTGVRSCP